VMFFSFSSAMVMFTCEWMGCVGGNAERELLLRELPCGLDQIQPEVQPAPTSLESSPKKYLERLSAGKEMASFRERTAMNP
jgi:hypothetical protein